MGCAASSVEVSSSGQAAQLARPDRPTATVPDPDDELTKSRLLTSRDTCLDRSHALDRTESAALPQQVAA